MSLPVEFDAELTCLNSTSTAAVGLDGTMIVRTYEQGIDGAGRQHLRARASVWPQLLK